MSANDLASKNTLKYQLLMFFKGNFDAFPLLRQYPN